jgi:hypothetical protein
MANFTRDIEDSLLTHSGLLWMFKEFRGFDDSKSKHLKIAIEKQKSDEVFDVDIVTITMKSDEELHDHIQVRDVINSVISLDNPELKNGIKKALFLGSVITEIDGIWTAEISMMLINNAEKLTESPDILTG